MFCNSYINSLYNFFQSSRPIHAFPKDFPADRKSNAAYPSFKRYAALTYYNYLL